MQEKTIWWNYNFQMPYVSKVNFELRFLLTTKSSDPPIRFSLEYKSKQCLFSSVT